MIKYTKYVVLVILSAFLLVPTLNVKAETLQDYINILDKYKKEQANNQAEINKTENAIKNNKEEIDNITKKIQEMQEEIETKKEEIIEYNNEIREKSIETKELFEYLQVAGTENLYLEYAFNADTITDLIYRVSVIEQITKYNEETINKLESMVKANEERQKELAEQEKEMEAKQEELTKSITNLTGVKASLNENSVSVSQQIKIYEELVNSYKNQGCQPQHVIGVDCAKNNSVAGWYRPIESGYVTSEFGYRWGSLHRAVDVSNKNPYNTKIYPVANGKITAKYNDYYGALTVVIEHKTANGQYYSSLYTHMSKYAPNIYVGKNVTINDYIGYMGDTGYAYGPHLHLEIAPCRLYNQYDSNCSSWNKYTAYVAKIYNNKSFNGPRDLIYYPKLGVTFKGR